jgi:two-component system NarL family sensor kinase
MMNRSILILFLAFWLAPTPGLGQAPGITQADPDWTHKRDSLLKALSHTKEDTTRVWTLEALSEAYMHWQSDSILFYVDTMGRLAKKLNYPAGMVSCATIKAWFFAFRKLKADTGIAFDLEAIRLAAQANLKKMLGRAYNNTANIYKERKEDYSDALDYYLKALDIVQQLRDTGDEAMILCNIGLAYGSLKENQKGYEYTLQGIRVYRSIHLEPNETSVLGLSSSLIGLKRYDTALVILAEARARSDRLNDANFLQQVLQRQIEIYTKTRQLEPLKIAATELLAVSESLSTNAVYSAWAGLSDYYYYKRDYKTATVFNDSLIAETKADTALGPLSSAYGRKATIELARGNLPAYDRFMELQDSVENLVLSDKILKNTQELETRDSLGQEQAQIKSLNDENKIDTLVLRQHRWAIWALTGLLIAFAVLAGLFYSNNRQKKRLLLSEATLQEQKIAELEKERQLLATRSVLLGQDEERKRLAKDLHDGLGGILSVAKYSFTNMKQNFIITGENADAFDKSMGYLDKSIRELRRVAHNMMPEALIEFGLVTALKDYCNSITNSGALKITYQAFELTDDSIPASSASVIYRIIQELINNILKHAHATTAAIQLVRRTDALSITVEDNGKGFDVGSLKTSAGIGFLNLRNRVSYLEGTVDIQTSPGRGTFISIEIPNITNPNIANPITAT